MRHQFFASVLVAAMCMLGGGAFIANAQQIPQTTPATVEVIASRFGVFVVNEQGNIEIFESSVVPAIPNLLYGWFLVFKANKKVVVWREEFELPVPLENWGPLEALGRIIISPDRKTAVTERLVETSQKFISNTWNFVPSDPLGPHVIRVYIDGQLVKEFRFVVEDIPEELKPNSTRRKNSNA